jgi:hypothetical protein
MKGKNLIFLIFFYIFFLSCKKDTNEPTDPNSNMNYENPVVSIDSIVNLSNTSVRVYVNIISIGGGESLETVQASYKKNNLDFNVNASSVSKVVGNSSFDISSLTPGKNYVVKILVANHGFKSAIDTVEFTTLPPVIGQSFLGGKYAYILQPGDNGYDSTIAHGMIVSWKNSSQSIFSNSIGWGCSGVLAGCNGTTYGFGIQNSIQLWALNCAKLGGNYAITECAKYKDEINSTTFSSTNPIEDWFLPSTDELMLIYNNRVQIGLSMSATSTMNYWSSTEYDADNAWVVNLSLGSQYITSKNNPINNPKVLAISYF